MGQENNFGYKTGLESFPYSQQETSEATESTALDHDPTMEAVTCSTRLPQGQNAAPDSVTCTRASSGDSDCHTMPTNPTENVVRSSQNSAAARRPIPRATLPNTDIEYVEAGLSSRRTYSNKERGRSDFERRITPRSSSHSPVKNVLPSCFPCDTWGETSTGIQRLLVPEHLDSGVPSSMAASRAPKPIEHVNRWQKEGERHVPIPRVVLPPSLPHERPRNGTKEVRVQALDAEAARTERVEDQKQVAGTPDEPGKMLKKKGGRKKKTAVYPDQLVLNGRAKSKTGRSVPTPIDPQPHQLPSTKSGAASWMEAASNSTEKSSRLSEGEIESRRKSSRQTAMPLASAARKAKGPVGCASPVLPEPVRSSTRPPQLPSVAMDASSTRGDKEASLSKESRSGKLSGAVNTTSAEQPSNEVCPPQKGRNHSPPHAGKQSSESIEPRQLGTGKAIPLSVDDGLDSKTQRAEAPRSDTQRKSATRFVVKSVKAKESKITSSGVKSAVSKGLEPPTAAHSAKEASEKDLEEAPEEASVQWHSASTRRKPQVSEGGREKESTNKPHVPAETRPKSEHDNDTAQSVARTISKMDELVERAEGLTQTPPKAWGANLNTKVPATSSEKSSSYATLSKARGHHITAKQCEPHRSQFEELQDLSNSGNLGDPGHDSSASSITVGRSRDDWLVDAGKDADTSTDELPDKTARLVTVEKKMVNSDLISQAQSMAKKEEAAPAKDGGAAERTEIVSVETDETKAKTQVDVDEAVESDKRSPPEAPKKKKKKKKLKTGTEKKRQKREQMELVDLDADGLKKGAKLVSSARESNDEDWTSVSTSTTAVASPQKSTSSRHLITVGGMKNLIETTQAEFPGIGMKNSGHWVRYDTEDGQVQGFGFKPKLDDRGRPTSQNNNIHGFDEPWKREPVQYGQKIESINIRAEKKPFEGKAKVKNAPEFVGDNVRTITNPRTGKVKLIAKRKSKFGKGS